MSRTIFMIFQVALVPFAAIGQANCDAPNTSYIPINDLGTGTYLGMVGGLYPNGSNLRPEAHNAAGLAFAAQVQPRDAAGVPDPVGGKVVWLSLGFSNATQETQAFIPLANALPNLNPDLVLVDGAQGGQTATILSTPTHPSYASDWNTVANRLANAGVTAQQVQAIWLKDDNPASGTPIDQHSDSVLVQFKRIAQEVYTRFPNAHLCYVASRIYAGYASTPLNPEPYSYRNGWTMKALIGDQIAGDPQLVHSGPDANSPWLSWGTYLWADGTNPRSDGLTWNCPDDYQNDGTHPSPAGRSKVANLLLDFFTTDETACPWFLDDCGLTTGVDDVAALDFSIAPNPASSMVNIQHPSLRNGELELFDAMGRKILSRSALGGNTVLDTHGIAPGTYHLVLRVAMTRSSRRLLITAE